MIAPVRQSREIILRWRSRMRLLIKRPPCHRWLRAITERGPVILKWLIIKWSRTDNPQSELRLKNQFGNSYEHFENRIRPNSPGADPAPGLRRTGGNAIHFRNDLRRIARSTRVNGRALFRRLLAALLRGCEALGLF